MEKPPMLYWLTALSFSLFGITEWSARLVPAISALSCVAMMLRLGNAIQRPRAGQLGAFMFIAGLGVSIMSRLLMFDMLLTACLTGAFFPATAISPRAILRNCDGLGCLASSVRSLRAVSLQAWAPI